MKPSRGNVKNELLPVVWTLVAICLVLGILAGCLMWKLEKNRAVQLDYATADSDRPVALTDRGDGWLEIKTAYGSLRYPAKWREYLRVYISEDLGCRVQFSCRADAGVELPLFDISIGEMKGDLVGYLEGKNAEAVPVYLYTYAWLTEDARNHGYEDTYLAMQEELNQVLEQIGFIEDLPVDPEDVVIETPYGKLTYPGEYQYYLRTRHKENAGEYAVEFYCVLGSEKTQKMFTVTMNDDPEGAVHTIKENGKNVHIAMEEPSLDGLSQEKQNLLLAMMEAVNDLFDTTDR